MTRAVATLRGTTPGLALPLGASVVLHVGIVVSLAVLGWRGTTVQAEVYRVNLIAAPAGPRQIGVVSDAQPKTEPPPTPPKTAQAVPEEKTPTKTAPVRREPVRATPTPAAREVQRREETGVKAGGGPEGGKGTDVANVRLEGAPFPYQAYLDNIVRQIALRFKPRNPGSLSAEVMFLIRRDGSVTGIQLRRRSGVYAFDVEAMGSVEAASTSFGPLPDGYSDDVLTVIFSFDPRLIR